MRGLPLVLAFVALTAVSWGVYGPALNQGKAGMGGNALLPFVCVGLAYFGIAVAAPAAWLLTRGEKGSWSVRGTLWSLVAGAAGALGALGIIMALMSRGNPVYVMPLVFGGAPVVNTFFTMLTSRTYKEAKPLFYAGLILVVAGAATVLIFRPAHGPKPAAPAANAASAGGETPAGETAAAGASGTAPSVPHAEASFTDLLTVFVWIVVTALSWGIYGPVLHWGQAAMAGSRLRPFLCVGLAYFLMAVLVPGAILASSGVPSWTYTGAFWSLLGGAAGAVGALGIILAFNFGGKPIYVMPLVFGLAPVVNTFVSLVGEDLSQLSPLFYAGLILVAVGAVVVLVFAPKGHPPAKPPETSNPWKPEPAASKA
jgi:hypothetical protein